MDRVPIDRDREMEIDTNCNSCGRPIRCIVKIFSTDTGYCPNCYPKAVSKREQLEEENEHQEWKDCPSCRGTGKIKGYLCQNCKGEKGYYRTEVKNIFIRDLPRIVKGTPI